MTTVPLYDAIRRYAARLLKNLDAGEDIAQEVFLRLEQQRETVTQPQAWAYRTARNLVIDQFRRAKNRARPTESLPDDLPADATRFDPVILAEHERGQIPRGVHRTGEEGARVVGGVVFTTSHLYAAIECTLAISRWRLCCFAES